jgi:hypothetical protein
MANGLGSHEDPRAVVVFSETSTRQDVVCRTHTFLWRERAGLAFAPLTAWPVVAQQGLDAGASPLGQPPSPRQEALLASTLRLPVSGLSFSPLPRFGGEGRKNADSLRRIVYQARANRHSRPTVLPERPTLAVGRTCSEVGSSFGSGMSFCPHGSPGEKNVAAVTISRLHFQIV